MVRREDVPLHDDVRWLAASLGRVIRRLEGDPTYQAVESLRQSCRARRRGDPDARSLDELLAEVEALPIERAAVIARAFTLFFLLINTAEQVHRVRRARAYRTVDNEEPQPASARWAMRSLHASGLPYAAIPKLHLSAEQTKSIDEIVRAYTSRLAGMTDEEKKAKGQAMGKEYFARMLAVLTPQQQDVLKNMRRPGGRKGGR